MANIIRTLDRHIRAAQSPGQSVLFVEGEGFHDPAQAGDLSDAVPVQPAPTGSPGVGGKASRDDHRHPTGPYNVRRYVHAFSNAAEIVVTHNLGTRPLVQVLGGASGWGDGAWSSGPWGGSPPNQVLVPSSIVHDNEDQLTVTLAAADSGEVVCIGSGPLAEGEEGTLHILPVVATALEAIAAGQAVCISTTGGAVRADSGTTSLAGRVIGLAMTSAGAGQQVQVQATGRLGLAGWGLTPGALYYVGLAGALTTTIPTSGFLQIVGVATGAATMAVQLSDAILL